MIEETAQNGWGKINDELGEENKRENQSIFKTLKVY